VGIKIGLDFAVMSLRIVEIHRGESAKKLNTEWFVLLNEGDKALSTKDCSLSTGKGKSIGKHRSLGTMDPGFVIAPGEKVRVVTGNPGKKSQGAAPDDGLRNYSLFLGALIVQGPGTVLTLSLRSHVLASATFDPNEAGGVAKQATSG